MNCGVLSWVPEGVDTFPLIVSFQKFPRRQSGHEPWKTKLTPKGNSLQRGPFGCLTISPGKEPDEPEEVGRPVIQNHRLELIQQKLLP